ncbi:MAG: hypothetical protein K2X81_08835, partial [Candidatus Obscuribacterales bacterium]|nr:hypothetical protein [Candidatus Obscuribacterales bacterium]
MSSQSRSDSARKILLDCKSVLENDHFVYITGHHGNGWLDKDRIYPHTELICELARLLADELHAVEADIVCGPATGGLVLSQWLAHHLKILSVFAEHNPNITTDSDGYSLRPNFVLRRNYDKLVKGKKVIVVDDILNTGHSMKETAEAVVAAGGEVVCAAAICSRGNTNASLIGVNQLVCLTEIIIPSWAAETCELCRSGKPVNTEFA